jgi:hypothetical protein
MLHRQFGAMDVVVVVAAGVAGVALYYRTHSKEVGKSCRRLVDTSSLVFFISLVDPFKMTEFSILSRVCSSYSLPCISCARGCTQGFVPVDGYIAR